MNEHNSSADNYLLGRTPRAIQRLLLLGQISAEELDEEASLHSYARLLAAAYVDQDAHLRPPYFDLRR